MSYIYLLQEREFIKTDEEIYKMGKTKQENDKRFKQYPKGSKLLLQKICDDCDGKEKTLLAIFKNKFKQRKDIGTEYFEGNYKAMIVEIEKSINKDDMDKYSDDKSDNSDSSLDYEDDVTFVLDTYDKLIKFTNIKKIVTTHRTKLNGYLKFPKTHWRKIKDVNEKDFDKLNDEDLESFIEHACVKDLIINKATNDAIVYDPNTMDDISRIKNQNTYMFVSGFGIARDFEKIKKDVLKNCYDKNAKLYDMKYNEYIIMPIDKKGLCMFDALFNLEKYEIYDFPFDNDKIIAISNQCGICFNGDKNINIDIVAHIFMVLTNNNKKIINDFKKLCHNTLVELKTDVVFVETGPIMMYGFSSFLSMIMYRLGLRDDDVCHANKSDYKKMKNHRICIYSTYYGEKWLFIDKEKEIQEIIEYAKNNNVHNLIIKKISDEKNSICNVRALEEYIKNNREVIHNIIKENCPEKEIHISSPFYDLILEQYLVPNILRWIIS